MVYAKDMRQVVDQIKEKERQEHIEKTRQYCHSTLSKMIEEKAYKGIDYVDLHISAPNKEGICSVLEDSERGTICIYKESLVLETVKEILSDHAYTYHMTTDNFCTYRGKTRSYDIWKDGFNIHISW